jgi:hypothetical protein
MTQPRQKMNIAGAGAFTEAAKAVNPTPAEPKTKTPATRTGG